jgi:hypothetical protein
MSKRKRVAVGAVGAVGVKDSTGSSSSSGSGSGSSSSSGTCGSSSDSASGSASGTCSGGGNGGGGPTASCSYWLFKSEPDEFGMDHLLHEPEQTACWDGVRNYQVTQ